MEQFERNYLEILAEHIADYLTKVLANKSAGHRSCVLDLPNQIIPLVWERIIIISPQVEAYILAESSKQDQTISPSRLIERRNISKNVLLVLIPQGLKTAAEDSYGEHTFENISIRPALYDLRRKIISQLSSVLPSIEKIVNSPHARRQPIEKVLRYLLAVQTYSSDSQSPGRYLYHMNLIPDLGLSVDQLEARIDRNSKKVEILAQADKPLLSKIELLKLRPDSIQAELFQRLRESEATDLDTWLPKTLDWGLTFDHWVDQDTHSSTEPISLTFEPLIKFNGLSHEIDDFVAYTSSPITVRWQVKPAQPVNISYFLLTLLREEREDEELLPPKRIASNRRNHKFDLRNVELDETEGRAIARLEIRAISAEGETLASDQGDPFWIEKGSEGLEENEEEKPQKNPNGEEVHSVTEAILLSVLRRRRLSSRKIDKITIRNERSGWVSSSRVRGAVKDVYRFRLSTNDVFHVKFIPILRDIERSILDGPETLRSFRLTFPTYRSVDEPVVDSQFLEFPVEDLRTFLQARAECFNTISLSAPGALVELADLTVCESVVQEYARAYLELTTSQNLYQSIATLDTVELEVQGELVLLLSPTHPLRLLWLLQYQLLLHKWMNHLMEASSREALDLFDRDRSLEKLTSLNTPAFLATGQGLIWVNTENLNIYWSAFLSVHIGRDRDTLSTLYRLLRIPSTLKTASSTIRASQITDLIKLYLEKHPYVRTLALNIINPGDGQLILDALREIQETPLFRSLNYDIRFFSPNIVNNDEIGTAFDELMDQTSEQRAHDVDDEFLITNPNPLHPKLVFRKHRVDDLFEQESSFLDAHITILLDYFQAHVTSAPLANGGRSFQLYGLLTEYQTSYHENAQVAWLRSIQPGPCQPMDKDDPVTELIARLQARLLQWVAETITGSKLGEVPAIQLSLSEDDLALIRKIHATSDWVLTVDRNFGVEFFDRPILEKSYQESYLIDFTPEFLGNVGHRLFVSTVWLSEIENILARALRGLNLFSENLRPIHILNALRSVSGRLALQLLDHSSQVERTIALGLAQIYLSKLGELKNTLLIPAMLYPALFGEETWNLLAVVQVKDNKLWMKLISVRLLRDLLPGNEYIIRNEVYVELSRAEKKVMSQIGELARNRIDVPIHHIGWATLLDFFLNRSIRYGAIEMPNYIHSFQQAIEALRKNEEGIEIFKEGILFKLDSVGQPVEEYEDVILRIVGRDFIEKLGHYTQIVTSELTETAKSSPNASEEKERSPTTALQEAPTVKPEEVEEQPYTSDYWEIPLGHNVQTGRPVFWSPNQPGPKRLTNQHILIVGKSGSGKTQTIMSLVYELWKQSIPSLLLDFHGEYCDASSESFRSVTEAVVLDAARGIPLNPLSVPADPITNQPSDYRNVIYQVTESLADIFGLGDIQKRILKLAVEKAYQGSGFTRDPETWKIPAPPFKKVWEGLLEIEQEKRGTSSNLLARVEPIFESEIFGREDNTFDQILKRVTVVRLSSLANKELRIAISRFFLQKIYERMLSMGPSDQQRLFCIVDEAHKLSKDTTITDLIKEARKYGVGLVLSSQETHDFDRSIFANTGTLIALQLEVEDARVAAENLGILASTERVATVEVLMRQRPGQALIHNNHYYPYIQVQIEPFHKRIDKL